MKKLPFVGHFPKTENAELFRWGPVPGFLFYMSEFTTAIFEGMPKLFPSHQWPDSLALFHRGRMLWLNELEEFRGAGKKIFETYILDRNKKDFLYGLWHTQAEKLHEVQERIKSSELEKLSEGEFVSLWHEYHTVLIDAWCPTMAAELGNYGSDVWLKEMLKPLAKGHEEQISILEALTAPERRSFYQEEEIELSETDDLASHQKKHFWLKNSYGGTEVLPLEFFEERKKGLPPGLRQKSEKRIREAKEKKRFMIEKYDLPPQLVALAEGLSDAIVWQDERKREILISLHFKELLLKEASRRSGYSYEDLRNSEYSEIEEVLKGEDKHESLEKRHLGCYAYYVVSQGRYLKRVETLLEPEIEEYWNFYAHERPREDPKTLKGMVASKGNGPIVRGFVKIVFSPKEIAGFEKGKILVTPMTSPEFVFAMKKAAAIVTDTGGLTSHAAIVSRELGVPCIVGTKMATRILKDGDRVEVDANLGIVRKLNPETE